MASCGVVLHAPVSVWLATVDSIANGVDVAYHAVRRKLRYHPQVKNLIVVCFAVVL